MVWQKPQLPFLAGMIIILIQILIGKLMPNAEVKIGENNEILVRGGMVMKG